MRIAFISCLAATMIAGVAAADEITLTPQVGTLGVGIGAEKRLNDDWGARFDVSGASFSFSYAANNADTDNRARLFSLGATADYYPYEEGLRLSGGFRLSGSYVKGSLSNLERHVGKGQNKTTVIIRDPLTTYKITQNPVQPYLGLGYSLKIQERLSVTFDLGALYGGQPDLNVVSHADLYGFTEQQIEKEIRKQQERLNAYQVYPVVQIGLTYRF
ncbi:hypothetical protein M2360_002170 [Rhizobium sp. SG_E_25_P2]|uniref:hypothetical protein n=1 Tax=Rhizobium sp. SG_E_25_P2 TaxID=2879942 RepID=UPI00247408B7|nr:hypothetical protein [Rhizobium sp. SG_E_25_P2]MDH6266774.1 hypothetical protein [Rhizobium sp. SG_E_25_P2]